MRVVITATADDWLAGSDDGRIRSAMPLDRLAAHLEDVERVEILRGGDDPAARPAYIVTSTGQSIERLMRPVEPESDGLTDVVVLDELGYKARWKHLLVMCTETLEDDGRWWRHVSVSRQDRRMPTWRDMSAAKDLTIGPDRAAIQVMPKAAEHVDVAGNMPRPVQVLHLWACEHDVLPDFRAGSDI